MSITSWDLKLHELRVDIIASNYGEISPAFIGGTAPPSICTLRKIHGFSETKKNTSMVGFPHHWFTGGYTNKISVELH